MRQRIVDKFHLEYDRERVWEKTTWLGIPIWKLPFDAFIIQELIFKLRPDYIIETGTGCGGSSLFYASIMELLGKGQVITIDVEKKIVPSNPLADQIKEKRIVEISGSSVEPRVYNLVRSMAQGKDNLVILDSWHCKEHVLEELDIYSDLVKPGFYIIVEDTHVNKHPIPWQWGAGPYEAVQDFLKYDRSFLIDKDCEKLFCTFNPGGYLKRIA